MTTDATGSDYNGAYGCAVWIEADAGVLVRALYTATRITNMTGLPTRDNRGGLTTPGKYTLNVETHSRFVDAGTDLRLVRVPFDTSALPLSETGRPDGAIRAARIHCDPPRPE